MMLAVMATVACFSWQTKLLPVNCTPDSTTLCGENFDHVCTKDEYTNMIRSTYSEVDPDVAKFHLLRCEFKTVQVCKVEARTSEI